MVLRAVLLDIDGTLLDSNDAHAQAWAAALVRHGHEVPLDDLRPLIGKGGDKLLLEAAGIDIDSDVGKLIDDERRGVFNAEHLASLRATAGARALLERFKAAGILLVVATSAGDEDLKGLLRQGGIDDLVEKTATSSDAKESKPSPDIVKAALDKAGLDPSEAVMLGDTPHDIRAAAAAGVRTIALRCGGWWDDAALSGAVAIYDDPADLLRHFDESLFGDPSRTA